MSDLGFKERCFSSDFFLSPFMHEAAHNIHLENIRKRAGSGKAYVRKIELAKDPQHIFELQKKYVGRFSQPIDPLEKVAWGISRVLIDALDKEALIPTRNPFIGTPFKPLSFWQILKTPNYSDEARPQQEILRRFWNGKFD